MTPDIYLKIQKHNHFVETELLKANKGNLISLTEIMVNKEKIYLSRCDSQEFLDKKFFVKL